MASPSRGSNKGVHDFHSGYFLAGVEVFGVKSFASELACALEDHGVPERNLRFLMKVYGRKHVFGQRFVDAPTPELGNDFAGAPRVEGDGGPLYRVDVEFLKDLDA